VTEAARTTEGGEAVRTGVPAEGWAAFVVCLGGLLASAYLTYEHLTASTTLACPETGTINCAKVTTSAYSVFLGMPVSVLGLAYFVVMVLLCQPLMWRRSDRWLPTIRLLMSAGGVVFVLYLIWAELFRVNAICLWCTAVHVLTLALFGIVAVGQALRTPEV
jgi:uncharacterized membrane protein